MCNKDLGFVEVESSEGSGKKQCVSLRMCDPVRGLACQPVQTTAESSHDPINRAKHIISLTAFGNRASPRAIVQREYILWWACQVFSSCVVNQHQ